MSTAAILVLEDGSVFRGTSIGAEGTSTGEVVFNTAMTGYQEILTDPSYARQMVTLTYPHIGNTGTTPEDAESANVHAAGLIIREVPRPPSSWRNEQSLPDYLQANNTVAIADIDTRRLTRILRSKGAQRGCILAGSNDTDGGLAAAKAALENFPGMMGMDLAKEVTVKQAYDWNDGTWQLEPGNRELEAPKFKVVAYDFGVKRNILRILRDNGCAVHVVPAQTPAAEVLAMKPDGVFLSNGPGDPEPCDYAITAIKELLDSGIPLFGICLGHQLLGLAVGAKTEKMKFGHHGANHPVQDLASGEVMITSQNHGFNLAESSLPKNVKATHRSLFDGTLQGIELTDKPAYSFQGHPEASPGPHDIKPLFERFTAMMAERS